MGDVADILGGARRPQLSEGEALLMDGGLKTGGGGAGANKGKRKPAGMSREVFNLIGKEGMAPAVVSKKAVGLKDKREGTARTRWVFTTFRNSARKDQEKLDQMQQQGQGGGAGEEEAKEGGASGTTAAAAGQVFYHWVKAATDYPDYPFARFNVQTPPVEFTEEEYKAYLAQGDAAAAGGGGGATAWGKEETKVLLELCNRFDLRWPVIYDRFPEAVADAAAAAKEGGKEGGAAEAPAGATPKAASPQRSIEDLQARFYSVRKTLRLARQAAAAAAAAQGGVAPPQVMFQPGLDEDGDTFDHPYEKTRRAQLARLFRRSKEEELEVKREGREGGREGGW
jgi:DNA methyltransferase 1-associated protein 1